MRIADALAEKIGRCFYEVLVDDVCQQSAAAGSYALCRKNDVEARSAENQSRDRIPDEAFDEKYRYVEICQRILREALVEMGAVRNARVGSHPTSFYAQLRRYYWYCGCNSVHRTGRFADSFLLSDRERAETNVYR